MIEPKYSQVKQKIRFFFPLSFTVNNLGSELFLLNKLKLKTKSSKTFIWFDLIWFRHIIFIAKEKSQFIKNN